MQVPPLAETVVQVFEVSGKSVASEDVTDVTVMEEGSTFVIVKVFGLSPLGVPATVGS